MSPDKSRRWTTDDGVSPSAYQVPLPALMESARPTQQPMQQQQRRTSSLFEKDVRFDGGSHVCNTSVSPSVLCGDDDDG
ncbi:hypothetical protein FOA52_005036 [Chlamydomonas sp. UWO 241]|nr:hypothetical protein FOA52_005036 [Chlamydomonas sp. UWO 241]